MSLTTILCGGNLKGGGVSIAGLSFGPNLCGKQMVHVFFGKRAGVAAGLLIGMSCQVVDWYWIFDPAMLA